MNRSNHRNGARKGVSLLSPTRPGSLQVDDESTLAKGRNPGIDLLRGVCILLVVMHHVGLRLPLRTSALAHYVPRIILNALTYNGYEAVFVFFVVSGFLITTNARDRWGALHAIDFRSFYARRASRILPCLFLLVAILSALHLARVGDYVIDRDGQSLSRAAWAALGLHLNWYEGKTGYLPGSWDVLWSLSIEEVFYLGFPVACFVLRWRWALVSVLIMAALSLPVARGALEGSPIWQEKAYFPGMAAIATGVLASRIAVQVRGGRRVAASLIALGSLGLVAILLVEGALWKHLGESTLLVLTASAACLVVGLHWAAARRQPRPWRALNWLRAMGRLSYEVYLTHMFVVFAVVRAARAIGGEVVYGFLWYPVAIIACLLLGGAVARYFSVPCERELRRRFAARAPARSPEEADATGAEGFPKP